MPLPQPAWPIASVRERPSDQGPRVQTQPRLSLDGYRDTIYARWVIRSYADKDTERFANRERIHKFQSIERVAIRKLRLIDDADSLADLTVPFGKRLETLRGDREGQYSIRINDQYRICFRWKDGDAFDVAITDYR